MPNFQSNQGSLEDTFLNDYELLERKAGSGTLWAWGHNQYGQIGDGTAVNKSSPVQTIASGTDWLRVSSHSFTAAIKTDGTLWVWGQNGFGQLDTNDTVNRSSPIQTVAGGTNWYQISNNFYSTGAIKTDGTLWLCGINSVGQLGTNDITHRSSPVQTIAGGTNWRQISGNNNNFAAIKTDGTLWLWGHNQYGQLGTNDTTHRSSPIQTVAGGTSWRQVSGGSYHTMAIKTDNTLWVWGDNTYGQLGTNDRTHRSSPVQTIAGGTNWRQISASGVYSAAIKSDGTLWLWGEGTYGQLGGVAIHRSSPIQTVAGGTNWRHISCGNTHAAAIKTDGTLWLWGHNQYGQLGINDTTNRSSPIQTVAGGTNWRQVEGKFHTTVAVYWNNTGYPSAIS